ncbi:MAG: PEP-CTERM sorting domain-containing protein [Gammaproteobacteria bacterium]|nr:PEP-CTERM sorting domain-containing protein [Gammaproteobacteria bacterium]
MKTDNFRSLLVAVPLGLASIQAQAAQIDLVYWGYNIDGTQYSSPGDYSLPGPGQLPASINDAGFVYSSAPGSPATDPGDLSTGGGLGTVRISITDPGLHSIDVFFDHEMSEPVNTYYNETGHSNNSPMAGQSWEIDEPGFASGDIFLNFQDGMLDNTLGTSVFGPTPFPEDDVSMALGWDFSLAVAEVALITFEVSRIEPTGGAFYLTHEDQDSGEQIFFSSSLAMGPEQIPTPPVLALLGMGLIGLFGRRKGSHWN